MTDLSPPLETMLQINRIFNAPRDKVFRAWTEPEALKQWWGPAGISTPLVEIDLRVGGRYRFGMQFPDQPMFYVNGAYLEVQPPEKLVFTWRWEQPDMDFGESRVTVEFYQRGAATEVILTHDGFPAAEICQHHRQGWDEFMEKLVQQLEREAL